MAIEKSLKTGYLFIASGAAFIAAALIGEQRPFYGVAIMFGVLGIAYIRKSIHSRINKDGQ
ncbi:hypothetical protein SG34_016810 [Thalassomonas viridans]|uniref:Uncharacterized protein n=1 Tax=Thalassomonas viridans TaxID=137584 RepID=A0AAE9YZ59_9GAMM|nr:hypothetical protein [Thalassomonas viridans]WDE03084.1 hypothetical protein SG34_016810 [Thalassomonas viridans]